MLKAIKSAVQRLKNDYAELQDHQVAVKEVRAYLQSDITYTSNSINSHTTITKAFSMVFALVFFLVFTACRNETGVFLEVDTEVSSATATTTYNNVDEQLWIYLQRFEEEGAKRGWSIDLNATGLTGEIDEIAQEHVAGQCTYSSQHPNHILIDETFFQTTSDLGREFIIFHELGHCVLDRGHEESSHADGTCKSLMRSGLEECVDNYNNTTRSRYLDELFERLGA